MKIPKRYHLIFFSILFVFLSFNATVLNAGSDRNSLRDLKLALSLTKKFWMSVQQKKHTRTSKMLAKIYQALNPEGVIRTKNQQLKIFQDVDLIGFGFNKPNATRKDGALVFTYDLIAIGEGIRSGPRTMVWKKIRSNRKIRPNGKVKAKWKVISLASELFNPPT